MSHCAEMRQPLISGVFVLNIELVSVPWSSGLLKSRQISPGSDSYYFGSILA